MNISVVIPNYNGAHLFPQTLPTVFEALNLAGAEYEVIIVDDCSTDGSVTYLQENYPRVRLLSTPKNSGFSKTMNTGIREARFDLVLILNSDIRLTPGYFSKQLRYFDRADTFGVMGRIIGWDDDRVQDGGKYPSWQGFKLKTSLNYLPADEHASNYSLYLSGANALVSREKLQELGGFNEEYSPFYIEDVDLGMRAWRMGWKCYFETEAVCRHKTSATIRSKDRKNYIKTIYNRNKLYFHAFHLEGAVLLGWWIQTCFELVFRTLIFQFHYLRAFRAFLNLLPGEKKKQFNRRSSLTLKEVARHITGSVRAAAFFKS